LPDLPVSFKSQVNLVMVPVVVRDRMGKAIGGLRKEDFRLYDGSRKQEIAHFSVQHAANAGAPIPGKSGGASAETQAPESQESVPVVSFDTTGDSTFDVPPTSTRSDGESEILVLHLRLGATRPDRPSPHTGSPGPGTSWRPDVAVRSWCIHPEPPVGAASGGGEPMPTDSGSFPLGWGDQMGDGMSAASVVPSDPAAARR